MTDSAEAANRPQQVTRLLKEIESLSNANVPTDKFFQEFLKRALAAGGARAVAVWLLTDEDELKLACGLGLDRLALGDLSATEPNRQLLLRVMVDTQKRIYRSWRASETPKTTDQHELAIDEPVVVGALWRREQVCGVLELFLAADAGPQADVECLQIVGSMCRHVSRYLERLDDARSSSLLTALRADLEQFALRLHGSLRVSEVAATAANEGRSLLACDRLSLAVQRGRKTVLTAISGQGSVNHRSNLVRALTTLTSAVMQGREVLTYTGGVEGLPPQIEVPLADYVRVSGSRTLVIVPLFDGGAGKGDDESPDEKKEKKPPKLIGGLVAENVSSTQPDPGFLQRVTLFADHVATALSNASRHEGLFLLPLWRVLGQVFGWFRGRNLVKAWAVVLVLVGVCLGLILVPYDFGVEAAGRLMPVTRQAVFCPWDGEVVELFVESGQHVTAGQKLLQLRNDDLQSRILAIQSELNEQQELLSSLEVQLNEAVKSESRVDEVEIQGQLAKTKAAVLVAKEQVELLTQLHSRLTIRAPISGVVATFRIDELLQGRPVRRGDMALEIMDETGPWRLELEVQDRDIGHVLRGRQLLKSHKLPVEFVLSTSPESSFQGELESVATTANISETEGNVVEVFVQIDADQLPLRTIGAEVSAKIDCGEKSLGYVVFGDIVDFVRRQFWW